MSNLRTGACAVALGALLPLVVASAPAGAAARPVSLAPAGLGGADRSCAGQPDQTAALQRWIDSVRWGSIARLRPNRCYRVEGTLVVRGKVNVKLEGRGSMIRALTRGTAPGGSCATHRAHVTVTNSALLEIQGLHVEGAHPAPGPEGTRTLECHEQHAFNLDGDIGGANNGVRLHRVTANRVYGDFVYVRRSDNVVIEESVFGVAGFPYDVDPSVPEARERSSGSGRLGIAIIRATNVTIRDNYLFGASRSAINIEPHPHAASVVSSVSIAGNNIRDYYSNVFTAGGSGTVTDVAFTDNVVDHFRVSIVPTKGPADPHDVDGFVRRNFLIARNRATEDQGGTRAVTLKWVDGVRLEDNTGPLQLYADGTRVRIVDAELSRNLQVTGNTFTPGTYVGRYRSSARVCERDNVVTKGTAAPLSIAATACK